MGKVRKLKGKKVSSTVQSTQHLQVLINKTNQKKKKKKNQVYFEKSRIASKNTIIFLDLQEISCPLICNKTGKLFYSKPFYEIAYIFKALSFVWKKLNFFNQVLSQLCISLGKH